MKLFGFTKKARIKSYLRHLHYVEHRLSRCEGISLLEISVKVEIAQWLIAYYERLLQGLVAPTTPEFYIKELLNQSPCGLPAQEMYMVKVLFTWVIEKRIEGF